MGVTELMMGESWLYLASHTGILGELIFHPSLLGKDERRAPLKMPVWEARLYSDFLEMRESPILTKTYFKYSGAF